MPFLTDLDSRAAVKGSRDPLGLVPVWSRFGRFVVGNLTTVSNSVRGFTTLLLGYYFAQAVHERDGESTHTTLDTFLTFEQLAGYARYHVNGDDDFRGRDRVVLRLQNGPKVVLGAESTNQILGNQKIYGLWGLFSVPARSSGLLATDETILTPAAREFVERQYIGRLTAEGLKAGKRVVDLLRREHPQVHLDGRDAPLARSLARILSPRITRAERAFYDHHLARGGDEELTDGRQPLLAELLAHLPAGTPFGIRELTATIKRAHKVPNGEALAKHLRSIGKLEALLVPMDSAFAFLLTRDRQTVSFVAGELRKAWGRSLKHVDPRAIAALTPTIAAAFGQDQTAADRFVRTAEAFSTGAYQDALRLLLDHNAFVMQTRNGSQPWARIENGKIDVRYRDESGMLIPGHELPDQWRNTYFINSLQNIVSALQLA